MKDDADTVTMGESSQWTFTDTNDQLSHVFEGRLLGHASSRRRQHTHDNPSVRRPCHACRWFEVFIFRVETRKNGSAYVVVFHGITTLANETTRCTVTRTASPYTVIETLTQQRNGDTYIPRVSRIALSESAGRDKGLEMAWIDRPTT